MAHIAVIGSIACDEVLQLAGPLRRGGHLSATHCGVRLGGGGANTAVALAAAGHHVTLLGAVGDDAAAKARLAELEQAGVDVRHVARRAGPTTRSLILVEPGGERTVVNLARCEEAAPPRHLLELAVDAVYVRSRRVDLAPLLARKAAECLIVAHVPPVDPGSRPAQVLVCSESDLTPAETQDALGLGASIAGERLRWIVVTAGPGGARALSSAEVLAVPAARVDTVDTTGAGDAFAAGLVHALVAHRPMSEALAIAARFGTEATRWASSGLPAHAVARLLR